MDFNDPPDFWRAFGPVAFVLGALAAVVLGVLWLIHGLSFPEEGAAGVWLGPCLSLVGIVALRWFWSFEPHE